MNKVYKVIWNTQLGCWQAVSELAKNHTSSSQSSDANSKAHINIIKKVSRSILFGLALLPLSIYAAISNVELPTGAQINSGSASFIADIGTNKLDITQTSQVLSSNWNTFNIGQDATVNFIQPNKSSVAINHVIDSNASQIMGRLNANGQVFLLNPNGVVFSPTAQVNVGGIVASTLNLNDAEIVNDTYILKGDPNSSSAIENGGSIVATGGTVALIAPNVKNTGTINTPDGITHLTSASQVTLALQNGSLTQYQVDQGVLNGLVENGGAIIADNGAVYLTAKAKDSLSKAVVNHTGIIEANRLTTNAKGEIILLGDLKNGEINVNGTLNAKGLNGQNGGKVETSAAKVNINNITSVSTASDTANKGTWLIDPIDLTINANATNPNEIGSTVLQNNLANSNITISTGGTAAGTQAGNITVNADLSWTGNSTLNLQADNDISLNKKITATNGGLTLNAANNISATDAINVGTFTLSKGNWLQNTPLLPSFYAKDFRINGGSFIRALGGDGSIVTPWTLTDIYGVQGMGTKLSGNFTLANDIDASGTVNWNSGAGFNPIGTGNLTNPNDDQFDYLGKFDGLGHVIDGLYVNRNTKDYGGLFGRIGNSSEISNVGLTNGSIYGLGYLGGIVGRNHGGTIHNAYSTNKIIGTSWYIGGIAGENNGIINNVYSTGNVQGYNNVGGLVGLNSDGTITNSYSTGAVNGGGLIGAQNGTYQIINSFWNTETSGQTSSAGGTGITTAQMFDKNNFTGFDFNTVWGNGDNQTTPYLLNMANNQVFNKNDLPTGAITSTNRPALYTAILNVNQLQNMNQNLSGKYLLGNNINASDTVNWNSGAGFNPIGNSSSAFSGVLDGLSHTVNGLTINRSSTNYVGLFGYISSAANLLNVGILNGKIIGQAGVGALVGSNSGTINNVFNGNTLVEGLGLSAVGGESATCSSVCSSVGGVIGYNVGKVSNAYSTGNVNGNVRVGGLVGSNTFSGIISNAYANGLVKGTNTVGSLVGENQANIMNSFGIIDTTGQAQAVGNNNSIGILTNVVGLTTAQMQDLNTFKNAGWSISGVGGENTVWRIYDGQTAPLLRSFLPKLDLSSLTTTTIYNGLNQTLATVNGLSDTLFVSSGALGGRNADRYEGYGYYSNQQGYDLIGGSATLTINPATLTITANDKNKTYGDTTIFAGTEFTSSGLQNGETVGNVNLSSVGTSATAGVNGGAPYAITASNATGGTFDANNYTISYSNGNLIVTPRSLTITANDKNKTYGDTTTFAGTEFTSSGLQNGETVGSVSLGSTGASATAGVNGGTPYAITASNATGGTFDANNYTISYSNGNLIVTPRSLTITANDKNKTYGDTTTFAGTEFTSSGLQNGETVGNVSLGSTGASATAGVNGGAPYAIIAGGATGGTFDANNYTISYSNGNLIVTPRSLTITANDKNKTYGDTTTFVGTEFTSAGLQNGETVGNVSLGSTGASATAGVNGGAPYAIIAGGATGGTFDANNYTISYSNGNLIVTPRSLTITANDKNKTYGDTTTFTGTEFTSSGLQNGETVGNVSLGSTGASATAGVNGGTPYAITASNATGGTFDANNYTISYSNGNLIVGKKDITVTANSGTSTYGDNPLNPNLSANGLVNGETESVLTGLNNSFGISNTTNAGNHTLTVDGTLSNGNYNITQRVDGTWVVAKKDITVTANSGTSTYGDNPLNPNLSATGLVNGETESVLTGLNNSFGINNTTNAGNHTLTVDGTLSNGNYNITQRVDGTWVVAKKDITVTANGGTSTYGDHPLNPNITASGLVNGETESVLTGLNNSFGIHNTSNAGSYTLSVDGTLSNGNYNITQRVDGTWVVGKKDITVTANSLNSTYNGKDQTATGFTATGLVNGESEAVLTGVTASVTGKNAGKYTNTVTGTDQNYDLTFVDGSLNIAKAQATVTANSLNSTYNGKDQTATGFTATGLVNGETEAVLSGVTASVTGKNAGSYTNTATGADQNYDLTFKDGALNIAKAKINQVNGITANNRVYDATSNATLNTTSAQFDGIVAGDELTVSTATGTFADKNVGTAKQVAIRNISLTGADVANYELINNTAQTTADISKANINNISGITANSRIYDGLTNATLNTANARFNGVYAGDQLTVASATGQFEKAATGQTKTVVVTGLSLGGIDAQNYNLVDTTALTQANINMLTPADYLQAIQFKRPSYLPKGNSSRNTAEIEVRQGGVNTSGIQTLAGEH